MNYIVEYIIPYGDDHKRSFWSAPSELALQRRTVGKKVLNKTVDVKPAPDGLQVRHTWEVEDG